MSKLDFDAGGALIQIMLYTIWAIDWSQSSDTTGENEEVTQTITM